MRIRRRLPIPLAVLLIVAAVALIVTLRKHAPPEAARLLPGADGFFYINLEWIRKFNATGQLPPVSREPEYQIGRHTSELQSRQYLVCRLLLEKKKHHICHDPEYLPARGLLAS